MHQQKPNQIDVDGVADFLMNKKKFHLVALLYKVFVCLFAPLTAYITSWVVCVCIVVFHSFLCRQAESIVKPLMCG
jgi:hypothetical protein